MLNSFSITGTAFTAVSTNTVDRTAQEIAKEKISTDKSEEISYTTSQKLPNSSIVAFKDPLNDKMVVLSLKNDTIDKLRTHFGSEDLVQKKDGTIRLDNKAEAFVSGWFGDIAYKREFLKADANSDGILDDKEYLYTRNDFIGHGEADASNTLDVKNAEEVIDRNYTYVKDNQGHTVSYNGKQILNSSTIDRELDRTINLDENFDSKMSLRESYNSSSINRELSNEDIIKKHMRESEIIYGIDPELLKMLILAEAEETARKIERASLEKLTKLNGELEQLAIDEQSSLEGLKRFQDKNGVVSAEKIDEVMAKKDVLSNYGSFNREEYRSFDLKG